MKKNILLVIASVLTWASLSVTNEAHAWKPKPPFCYYNCGIVLGEITAQPETVLIKAPSQVGSTTLRWKWDIYFGPPSFPLLCVYVQVNADAHASKVGCEWPGNFTNTTIPWIVAGNLYTFTLSPDIGNTVPAISLNQGIVGHENGKKISVDVIGVSY